MFSFLVLWTSQSLTANSPTIPYQPELIIYNGNTLGGYNLPFFPINLTETIFIRETSTPQAYFKELIREKYPELYKVLVCLLKEESGYGQNMRGDSGLAYGFYQIHLNKHPVTEECAMNFDCSLDYTAKSIKEGKGNWWTPYKDGRCNFD